MSAHINKNYLNLEESYLFADIAHRVSEFQQTHPDREIIRMGIGDVTRPLPETVVNAMKKACDEMGTVEHFHGYGPEQGYDFLRDAVRKYYTRYGVSLDLSEIFISDGAKSDCGNLLDILGTDNTVLVQDPVYPVYADTNVMDNRKIIYAKASEENGFLPMPQEQYRADIIYICSPNNPTGAVYSREQLTEWVNFALSMNSLILFDAAYECFIDGDEPHSIYEVPGAKKCAIEVCSFSKKAGFTGTRCGYTVVPLELERDGVQLNKLWLRRQTTKFNGVCYIVQRGAEAVFTAQGEKEISENIRYYKENAKIIMNTLDELGIYYTGGKYSPYIWMKCPKGMDSWTFFQYLLEEAGIVGTPGAGFGQSGRNFFRLTAFSTHENTRKAMEKFRVLLK